MCISHGPAPDGAGGRIHRISENPMTAYGEAEARVDLRISDSASVVGRSRNALADEAA